MTTERETYKQFVKGLRDYGLTIDEVLQKWIYCGSNDEKGRKKFYSVYPGYELPEKEPKCICGHSIVKQHYITDGEGGILVIGSECINNILHFSRANRCSNCKQIHKNRKTTLCNDCRKHLCDCGKKKPEEYKRCYSCHKNNLLSI
jgi:hypothetical protein